MFQYKRNKKSRFHFYIASFLHCLIVLSCAQISAPTGGIRDTTAPVIIKSTPENYTVNFNASTIKIVFDEWIMPLQNPKNQVIISPSIEPFPKITAARNELNIKLNALLENNTTYSIFFGDNIKDNNEGNSFQNYKYIFSTGKYIDSLKVKGNLNALEKIPDNSYLLLYKNTDDTAFTKTRPFYITKVNQDGSFSLENIKEGKYRIYALSDKNGNYYYDLPTEAIGFTDSVFSITSSIDSLNFSIFLPEEDKIRLIDFDRVIKGGIMNLMFNKELSFNQDEITAVILEDNEVEPIVFQNKKQKEATIYFPRLKKDTANYTIVLKNKEQLIDSIKVRSESKIFPNPVLFFNDTTIYKSLSVIETLPLKLISDKYALSPIDTVKIFLLDTASNKIPFTIVREEDLQTYSVFANWKSTMKYKLQFSDSVFMDLAGNFNKFQEFSFLALASKKSGNLLITYYLPEVNTNYIALLKDNSGKVLNKQILRDSQTLKINYGLQLPGTYNVELIEDLNNNGVWNSGNFNLKTLPEKIYKEIKPIIIKENWDTEEIIQADFTKKSSTVNTTSNTLPDNSRVINNPGKIGNENNKGGFRK